MRFSVFGKGAEVGFGGARSEQADGDEAEQAGEEGGKDGVAFANTDGKWAWMKAVSQKTVTKVPVKMLATAADAVARFQ